MQVEFLRAVNPLETDIHINFQEGKIVYFCNHKMNLVKIFLLSFSLCDFYPQMLRYACGSVTMS